ncbi:filamentous hemagglutinin N-terminal domain-containing protein [Aerosakkonema funiforme]|uniref:two-partner secretion domain-containing protein n=1 Tax=Aerosakkonema funiforme TaxID=1246630 RepID=UPI0035BA8EE7
MKLVLRSLYLATTLSCLCLFYPNSTTAQIVPDTTLPLNSIAIPNGNSIRIEGGTTAGGNLFHSFQEFSVPTGTEAVFNNSLDIQNIFSRVTGSNISNINGLIRANGTANLFLINPNGIIFGQNAQLNIGGSFIGSTANSIKFADGREFSATNPTAPSLLTINVPVGLLFGANPGSIVNRSQTTAPVNLPTLAIPLPFDNKLGLAVAPGQTLALVGGDIQIDGGNLTASTGQILLGSVASPGLVSFTPTPFGLSLNYDNIANFGNIQISTGSIVNTSGIGGGKVDIRGGNVTFSGGRIFALSLGNLDGRNIDIAAQKLRVSDGSQIFTTVLGSGLGGDLNIRATDSVQVQGIGFESYQKYLANFLATGTVNAFDPHNILITGTAGAGPSGNITIDTPRLLIENGAVSGSGTLGAGNGGNMTIRARDFEMVGSAINNGTLLGSTGKGGSITFEGERFTIRDSASIASVVFSQGDGGNIIIKASESVDVLNTPNGSTLQTAIATNSLAGTGKAGDIIIDTKRLTVTQGGGISSSNGGIVGNSVYSTGGPGGDLIVTATDSVEVSGISGVLANGGQTPSYLAAQTLNSTPGGNIRIATSALSVQDGGLISTASLNAGTAGDIKIDADRVEIAGSRSNGQFISKIEASAGIATILIDPLTTGNAGSINLNVGQLIVRDDAAVNVQALGSANAGNINVTANTLALDDRGKIDGATTSGAGANINLTAQNIQLRQESRMRTDAGSSTGGNITINTDTLAALRNSDITANAVQGGGGRVSITARGIFGIQFRDSLTAQSDITATSDLGPQFSGVVEINTPNIDPSAGLVELSANFEDVSRSIVSSCAASEGNSFTVTGNGGLPDDPSQTLRGRSVWRDLRSVQLGGRGGVAEWGSGRESRIASTQIVEATGWTIDDRGRVKLVAQAPNTAPQSSWYSPPGCHL